MDRASLLHEALRDCTRLHEAARIHSLPASPTLSSRLGRVSGSASTNVIMCLGTALTHLRHCPACSTHLRRCTACPTHLRHCTACSVQLLSECVQEGGESTILNGDPASEHLLSEIVGCPPYTGVRHMNMESLYEYGQFIATRPLVTIDSHGTCLLVQRSLPCAT